MIRLLLRIVLLGPLVLLVVAFCVWLALPWPVLLRWKDPDATSLMKYRIRNAQDADFNVRQEWIPLKEMSPHLPRAVVLAEDGRFMEHGGVDWHALAEEVRYEGAVPLRVTEREDWVALGESLRWAWENRSELRGRSTITQQLAKNLYWTPERSLGRKLGEFFVARRLEWFLTKDRILEIYLNTVELGPGVFGAEAAAREYWDVSAADLTPTQAASLAATLPHPLTSNPAHRPGRMAWRRDLILARMRGGGPPDASPIPEAPPEFDPPPVPELDPEGGDAGEGESAQRPDTSLVPDSADTGPLPDTASPERDTTTAPAPPDTTSGGGGAAIPGGGEEATSGGAEPGDDARPGGGPDPRRGMELAPLRRPPRRDSKR